ncbi:hypothetical protein [Nocardioides sp. YIM 152588]|uniref:hypothetical protein n=1 Tax=Nocardioides sp. YIM 152588 TaxID=3158259 RepID=UPI0032E3B097
MTVDPATTTLTFHDARVPVLQAGRYSLVVRQTVSGPHGLAADTEVGPASTTTFEVRGPRFRLAPEDVVARFPAPHAEGHHTRCYAHVEVGRATLPWERSAVPDADPAVPWLALLVLDAGRVTVADHGAPSGAGTPLPPGTDAVAHPQPAGDGALDQPTLLVRVRRSLLPATTEVLRERCHVRGGGSVAEEHAFVVGERPLEPGDWVAHLVSVEGLYDAGGGLGSGDDVVELVSLATWGFGTEGLSLEQRIGDLDRGGLRMPAPAEPAPGTEPVAHGHVALAHLLRDGGSTYSWYRGPLMPSAVDGVDAPDPRLPARHSDHLLRIDPRTGLLDVSYASAWELGRLLTLRNERVAVALHEWRQAHRRAERGEEERRLARDTEGASFHPALDPHPRWPDVEPALPAPVADWLAALARLEDLPFNHLVPDERMLPVEAVRFFHLDRQWVDGLLDGALSIGRVLARDAAADERHRNERLADVLSPPARAGFLLRSSIVSEWPGLLVDALGTDGAPADVVRVEVLSPDLMLGLFEVPPGRGASLASVEFHVHPGALHLTEPPTDPGGRAGSGAEFAALRESTGPRIRIETGLAAAAR